MRKPVGGSPHLWIIITPPNSNGDVAMVNVTTVRPGSDVTVIINAGEHHRITHRSVVFFQDARTTKEELVRKGIQLGVCEKCDPCSPELLKRIQNGLFASKFTPRKIIDFCRACWSQNR
ncbi:MAG: hypothetical protein ACRD2P_07955 [Terriglobia bacterium]